MLFGVVVVDICVVYRCCSCCLTTQVYLNLSFGRQSNYRKQINIRNVHDEPVLNSPKLLLLLSDLKAKWAFRLSLCLWEFISVKKKRIEKKKKKKKKQFQKKKDAKPGIEP